MRALVQDDAHTLTLVALNETQPLTALPRLLERESHPRGARLRCDLRHEGERPILEMNGLTVPVFDCADPADLPWRRLGVEMVIDCTGSLNDRQGLSRHLDAGAQRVLVSGPAKSEQEVDATIIRGVSDISAMPNDSKVVSTGSCTSAASAPLLALYDQLCGIESATITVIHSAMNDQPMLSQLSDVAHTARGGLHDIVPVPTRLDAGIARVLPRLATNVSCAAWRVPVSSACVIDLMLHVACNPDAKAEADGLESLRQIGVLALEPYPLVSADVSGRPEAAILDQSRTQRGDRTVRLSIWFDSETGFANQVLETAKHWARFS